MVFTKDHHAKLGWLSYLFVSRIPNVGRHQYSGNMEGFDRYEAKTKHNNAWAREYAGGPDMEQWPELMVFTKDHHAKLGWLSYLFVSMTWRSLLAFPT
jgi:hypothetical protein